LQVVAAELGKFLLEIAMANCDSGSIATWWGRHVPVKRGQMHTISGNLATMACGPPYTIASQVAYPERLCVGIVGDGGFSMLMAEFVTAVRYKLPIKILIMKNNSLGQIRWEQMVFLGKPGYACDLTSIKFTSFAQACGWSRLIHRRPGRMRKTLDRALQTPGPVLIEALIDPNEPPMPRKVTAMQVAHFIESLAKGPLDRRKILETIVADKSGRWCEELPDAPSFHPIAV
jgi:pyruvate dehydrogenase (quinone)